MTCWNLLALGQNGLTIVLLSLFLLKDPGRLCLLFDRLMPACLLLGLFFLLSLETPRDLYFNLALRSGSIGWSLLDWRLFDWSGL